MHVWHAVKPQMYTDGTVVFFEEDLQNECTRLSERVPTVLRYAGFCRQLLLAHSGAGSTNSSPWPTASLAHKQSERRFLPQPLEERSRSLREATSPAHSLQMLHAPIARRTIAGSLRLPCIRSNNLAAECRSLPTSDGVKPM